MLLIFQSRCQEESLAVRWFTRYTLRRDEIDKGFERIEQQNHRMQIRQQ